MIGWILVQWPHNRISDPSGFDLRTPVFHTVLYYTVKGILVIRYLKKNMDSAATTNDAEQVSAEDKIITREELNLPAEMEKVKELAKNNPVPAGKSVFI